MNVDFSRHHAALSFATPAPAVGFPSPWTVTEHNPPTRLHPGASHGPLLDPSTGDQN